MAASKGVADFLNHCLKYFTQKKIKFSKNNLVRIPAITGNGDMEKGGQAFEPFKKKYILIFRKLPCKLQTWTAFRIFRETGNSKSGAKFLSQFFKNIFIDRRPYFA